MRYSPHVAGDQLHVTVPVRGRLNLSLFEATVWGVGWFRADVFANVVPGEIYSLTSDATRAHVLTPPRAKAGIPTLLTNSMKFDPLALLRTLACFAEFDGREIPRDRSVFPWASLVLPGLP